MRERLIAEGHDRNRSIGRLAVRWMEHFLVHGPGDIQGTPLRELPLSTELLGHTLDLYALGADGARLYDSAFYSRPKGADKSGHAARIVLFEALGPCRFGGFAEGGEVFEWLDFQYVYAPGEPMGRRVVYPFIRCMATEEGQTGNTYDAVYYNLKEGPLREAFVRRDDVGLTRVFLPQPYGGEIVPSTASSASKDGGKETHATFDETHLYILPELKRMYSTVRRNLAKRLEAEPWSYETSTMYEVGRGSVAEASHELAQKVKGSPHQKDRPHFLFDHRQAPRDLDISSDEAIMAGLREAYGDADYMPFDRILSEIRDPRNELADSIRYFLNQAHASTRNAFEVERYRSLKHADEEGKPYRPQEHALIVIGFDGSRRRDSTAMIATEVATGFQWVLGVWARPEGIEDWSVPEEEVDNVLAEAMRSFEVWRAYCDPPFWETTIARWQGIYGDKVVIEWNTNRLRQMAFCIRAYTNAIAEGDLSHDGDARMADAIANSRRHELNFYDDEGRPLYYIEKERPGSPLKIDAAVAGALSWEARNDAIAAGAQPAGEAGVLFA